MSRDDQFAGFAKLLYEEFANSGTVYLNGTVTRGELSRAEVEQIIARRAYDLVHHALHCHQDSALYACSLDDAVNAVPDMRQWPEETSK